MADQIKIINPVDVVTGPIDCACLIHGDAYSWNYVERLYNMLNRHISVGIKLHVYTEANRPVPAPMIKHSLTDWGISGHKRGWWYKMQLFNPEFHSGPLLYFDLDTVIVENIDWIWKLPQQYFWTVQDFKYLWRTNYQGINSSIMWWNTKSLQYVWNNFKQKDLKSILRQYHGDQDYLNHAIEAKTVRFFDIDRIKSWRWQCLDGGYNFKHKNYKNPNSGTQIPVNTSVLIFHGNPKPDQINDTVISYHWQ